MKLRIEQGKVLLDGKLVGEFESLDLEIALDNLGTLKAPGGVLSLEVGAVTEGLKQPSSKVSGAQEQLSVDASTAAGEGETARIAKGEVDAVWAAYVEAMEPRNPKASPAERKIISDALKVATAAECITAIKACRSSDFHMGKNDRGRKYNGLSQILKGKQGRSTTRERIDFFLDLAEKSGLGVGASSADPARISLAKREVLDAFEFPNDEGLQRRGKAAERWLKQTVGIEVGHDEETGRPIFGEPS